ncbi:MAG: SPOR domain-containing protein [Nioella sp.]|uniref:SPOR domain-containing protein n=1 Tax=Nioella halotolerans TaxID=2303578 RepID=UPI002682959D
MAEMDYYEASPSRPLSGGMGVASGLSVVINWIGAILSVGLIVGLSVWAWQLTVRDVSGVPVIQALQGPMRVPPETPGGTVADHQGLAVNRITEGEEAAPAADRIVLAPAPLDLEEIDLTSASLPADAGPAPMPQDDTGEETLALIDRLLEEAQPLEPLADRPEPTDRAETTGTPESGETAEAAEPEGPARPVIEVIPASTPGVSRSLRPVGRPEEIVEVAALGGTVPAASVPEATPEVTELDPDALGAGTRLVQLGAFDEAGIAREEWQRLARLYPDFFREKDRVVQQATSGGREFYRLRAHGFADLADARRFCTALNAQGAPCIPVTVR